MIVTACHVSAAVQDNTAGSVTWTDFLRNVQGMECCPGANLAIRNVFLCFSEAKTVTM